MTHPSSASEKAERLERLLRALNRLALARYASFHELYDAHLRTGSELLELESGLVSRIEGQEYTVEAIRNPRPPLVSGATLPLRATFCMAVVQSNALVAYDDVTQREALCEHPAYTRGGLRVYIAAPIRVFGEIRGTLSFADGEVRTEPFTESEREFVSLMAISVGRALERDLEERQRRRHAAERERMVTIVESSPDVIGIADSEGRPVYLNRAAQRILGLGPDWEDQLASVWDAYPTWAATQLQEQAIPQALRTGAWSGESALMSPSRGEVPVLQILLVHRDEAGGIDYVSTVAKDISDRKRVERLKDEFVSSVSHELRTPLTSILGSLGLLIGHAAGVVEGPQHKLVSIAHRNAERLLAIVNDLLDMERLGMGRVELEREMVPVADLLRDAAQANASYAESFEVRLDVIPPQEDPPPMVHCDPARILQVLDNFISNAVKFSPRGAPVRIAGLVRGDRVRFSVTDRGPGVPEDFRDKLWEKFTQADASTSKAKGGTGLGLSIAKALVELHGGHIGFDSELGLGTTFFFDLPIVRGD